MRSEGKHIRPNLVCYIAIRYNPVCTKQDFLRFSGLEEIARHIVADDLVRDAILLQLPGGESRSL